MTPCNHNNNNNKRVALELGSSLHKAAVEVTYSDDVDKHSGADDKVSTKVERHPAVVLLQCGLNVGIHDGIPVVPHG